MTTPFPEPPPRMRAAQWALSLGFAALLLLGPVVFVGADLRTARAAPPATTAAVRDGSWARALETWLRETSSVTRTLRGRLLEAEWLLAVPAHAQVVQPTPGWMFLARTLRPLDPAQQAGLRGAAWRRLADRARAAGVDVVVLVAPDKARVYADFAYPGGTVPAPRADLLRDGIAEMRAAGLTALDPMAAFARHRREHPSELLYARRDTHWNAPAAALAVALVCEAVGPPGPGSASPAEISFTERLGTTGLVSRVQGFPADGIVGVRLAERRVEVHARGTATPGGSVALCGDSFAEASIDMLLPALLGRRVDARHVLLGSDPWQALDLVLDRVEAGAAQYRLVVHVFAERGLVDADWSAAP